MIETDVKHFFIALVISIVIIETICELVTESYFFESFREFVAKKSFFFGLLVSCGYCLSIWVAIPFVLVIKLNLTNTFFDYFRAWLLLHRLSNYLHHFIVGLRKRETIVIKEKKDETSS